MLNKFKRVGFGDDEDSTRMIRMGWMHTFFLRFPFCAAEKNPCNPCSISQAALFRAISLLSYFVDFSLVRFTMITPANIIISAMIC